MIQFFKRGEPFIWLAGSALAFCLILIVGLVGLVIFNGVGFFWPKDLERVRLASGQEFMGHALETKETPGSARGEVQVQYKVGNRDVYGADFRWVDAEAIKASSLPELAVVIERVEWGHMFGFIRRVEVRGEQVAAGDADGWEALQPLLAQTAATNQRIHRLEKDDIGAVNHSLEEVQRHIKVLQGKANQAQALAAAEKDRSALWAQYELLATQLNTLRRENAEYLLMVEVVGGGERTVQVAEIVRIYRPNALGFWGKSGIYLDRFWEFVAGQPRESNTEGGVFPALFGTVMMVILMSIAVVPFGILAAIYLREYAGQGALVRLIRIAVNNLAGVPSIVFGMFGLGFFVYGVGGTLDQLFYADRLPTPTFGTGGILWASLTLALLTVPVVVVATEEALSTVPRALREGSLALGSTKFQTIWKVVLPCALPGILTGIILATARGAGEVAPLMITGVVKLAPDLPLDGFWPFFHLERKFMHLGFHIYDVGFQSPNVEAARPMVYTTTFLLLLIILLLNLTAIVVRNRLRKRHTISGF